MTPKAEEACSWQPTNRSYEQDGAASRAHPSVVASMGRGQLAAATSGTHSLSMWSLGDINNQQKIPCIISSLTTGPGPWQLEHYKQCMQILAEHRSEFPESTPAPCKQLSRQKNSTNSTAEVRWLNILSAFFWVCLRYLGRVSRSTRSAQHWSKGITQPVPTVQQTIFNLFWRNKKPHMYVNICLFQAYIPESVPWVHFLLIPQKKSFWYREQTTKICFHRINGLMLS